MPNVHIWRFNNLRCTSIYFSHNECVYMFEFDCPPLLSIAVFILTFWREREHKMRTASFYPKSNCIWPCVVKAIGSHGLSKSNQQIAIAIVRGMVETQQIKNKPCSSSAEMPQQNCVIFFMEFILLTTDNMCIHTSRLCNGWYTCIISGIVWNSLPYL